MTSLTTIHLRSAAEIRAHAQQWDDLWWRSEVALPTVRAELAAQWIERFAAHAPLDVVVVEEDGQWVAALPLMFRRRKGLIRTAQLTANPWSAGGDLLLDVDADAAGVAERLAGAIARLPCTLMWFEEVPLETPRWRTLLAAIESRGMPTVAHRQYDVALVDLEGDWERYEKSRSKNLRQQTRRRERQLGKKGDLQFVEQSSFSEDEIEPILRRAFEVENRSWKGADGSTVLKTPGMFDFFVRQSHTLAHWGQLVVFLLEVDGRPIAFEYGYTAKGVYFPHKISFDDHFANYGPGQVIRRRRLARLFDGDGHRLVDCMGPLSRADRQWSTRTYPLSRLVVAPPRATSRAILSLYRRARPALRRLRGRPADHPELESTGDNSPTPQLVK